MLLPTGNSSESTEPLDLANTYFEVGGLVTSSCRLKCQELLPQLVRVVRVETYCRIRLLGAACSLRKQPWQPLRDAPQNVLINLIAWDSPWLLPAVAEHICLLSLADLILIPSVDWNYRSLKRGVSDQQISSSSVDHGLLTHQRGRAPSKGCGFELVERRLQFFDMSRKHALYQVLC